MSDRLGKRERRVTFTWKIENFLWSVHRVNEILMSPEFVVQSGNWRTKWCLRLYPCRSWECLDCYLRRVDSEIPKRIFVGFELSCITAEGNSESAYFTEKEEIFRDAAGHGTDTNNVWKWSRMLEKRSLYFPNDSFTIRCKMWTHHQWIHPVEYFAVTHLELTSVSYRKDIRDFYLMDLPVKCYPFPSDDLEMTLYQKNDSKYLSVELLFKSSTVPTIRLQCEVSVQDSNGILKQETGDYYFYDSNNVWKFPDFMTLKDLIVTDEHAENALNLHFDFLVHSGKLYSRIKEVEPKEEKTIISADIFAFEPLCRELESLYTEKRYTDVEIRSGEKSFLAHKLILRARSPVFRAMFKSDSKKKNTSVVHMDYVDSATLDTLLSFMYSGAVKNLKEDMATKLLSLADKFQVLTLKKECAKFLKGIVSVQNVCSLLQLSSTHHEESLQKTAQEFLYSHHLEIFSTNEWRLFNEHHGDLAREILKKLPEKFENKS